MSANKKQARQARLRESVARGEINHGDGTLGPLNKAIRGAEDMFRNLAFGYKLGRQLGLPVKVRK